MGLFKKLLGDAANELKKSIDEGRDGLRKSIDEMKQRASATFSLKDQDDDKKDDEETLANEMPTASADTSFYNNENNVEDDEDEVDEPEEEENESEEEENEPDEKYDEGDDGPNIRLGTLKDGVLRIFEGIEEIDGEMTEGYKGLRKIIFPSSLKKLWYGTIDEQGDLEELDFSQVTELTKIPAEFIYGTHKIEKFVVPAGVKDLGCSFLGDVEQEAEIYIPSSVEKVENISEFGRNNLVVYLFASGINLELIEEDIRTLYVLPKDYADYAKQLLKLGSEEVRLREMPREAMNVYK